MKTMLTSIATGLVLAAGAMATPSTDSLSETQNFAFQLSPGGTTLNFAQFDTSTGNPSTFKQLQKVIVTLDCSIGANVTAENDNIDPADFFAANLTGIVSLDLEGLSATAFVIEDSAAPGGVGGSDGVAGSGPDFFDFGFISGSDNDMDMSSDVAVLSAFTGNGFVSANLAGSGGFAISGASNATLVISNFGAEGTAKVEYFYKIIPTPGSAALIGVAGLVAAGRRRR